MRDEFAGVVERDEDLLDAYSRAVIEVVDTAGPAVLSVRTQRGRGPGGEGSGSGVIIAPDGFALTHPPDVLQHHVGVCVHIKTSFVAGHAPVSLYLAMKSDSLEREWILPVRSCGRSDCWTLGIRFGAGKKSPYLCYPA